MQRCWQGLAQARAVLGRAPGWIMSDQSSPVVVVGRATMAHVAGTRVKVAKGVIRGKVGGEKLAFTSLFPTGFILPKIVSIKWLFFLSFV